METHNHAPGFYEKVGHGFVDSTKQFPGLPATLPITQLQHHQLPHTMQKQHHSHQIMQHPNQNPSLLQNMNNKQQHHADPYFGNSSSMGTVAMNMIPMHQLQSPQPQVQQQQHPHMTSASSMNNVNGNHGSSFQYSKNVHHGNMNWTGNGNGNNGSSSGGGGGSILSMNPNSLRHNGVSGGPMDLVNMNSLYSSPGPGPGDNNINNHNHILPIGPGGPVSLRPGPGPGPAFQLHQASGGGRGGFQLKQNNQYYNTGVEMGTLSNPLAAANFPDGGRPRFGPSRDEMKDRLAESLAADNNITCLPGFKTRDDIRVSCVGNYPHMPALNQQQVRQQQQAQAVQLSSRTNPGISNNSGDSTFQRKMFGHDPAAGPGANGNNPAMFHPSRRSAASIAMVGGGGGGGSLPDFNEINRMNGMSMSQFSNLQMMNQACLPPAGISSVGSLHTSTTSYSAGAGGSNALSSRKFREGTWSSMGTPGPCTSTIDDAKAQKEGYRQELEKQIEQTKMRRDEETRRQKDVNDHPLGANYAQPKTYIPPKFLSSPNLTNMEMALRMSDSGNESRIRMEDPRSNSNGSLSYNSSNDTSTFGRFGFGSGFEFGSRSTPQQQYHPSQEVQGQQQRINKPGGHGGASFNSNLSNVGGAQLNSLVPPPPLTQTIKSSSGISNSHPHPPPNYSNSTPNCHSNLNAWNPNYGAGLPTSSYSPNQNQQHPVPMPVPVIPPSPMTVPLPVPIPVPGQPWPIYGAPMPQMLPFPPPFPHHHHPPPPPFFPHPPPPPPPHLFQHRLPHQPPPPPNQPPPLQFECGDSTGKLSTSTTGANVANENNTGMMKQPDVENLDQLIDELPLKQYTWQTSDQLPDPALKTLIYKEELRRQILQKKKDEEERAVREREEEDKLEQRIREYDERMRREVQEERNRIFVRGNPSLITSLNESTIQSQNKSPGQNQNHQNRTQQDRGDRGRASVQVPVMSINGEIPWDSSHMETGKTGEKREDVILIQENLTKETTSNNAAAGYGYGSTTTTTTSSDQPSASVGVGIGVGAGTLNKIGETESRQLQEERRQEQQQQQMFGSGDNSNNVHQKLQQEQEQHRYSQGHKEKRIEEDFNESGENGNDLENTFEARGRNPNPNPRTNNNGNVGTRSPLLPSVQTQKRLKTQSDSSLAGAGQQSENQFDKKYLSQSQNQNSSACGWDGESKPCSSRNRKLVGERGRSMNLNALSNILNSLGLETRRMERVIQKKINF